MNQLFHPKVKLIAIQTVTFNVSEQKQLLNYEFEMQQQTVMLCAILSVHQGVVVRFVLKTRLSNERWQQLRARACRNMRLCVLSNTFYVETHLKFSLFLSPCFV